LSGVKPSQRLRYPYSPSKAAAMPNCCSFVRFIMADLMMQTVTIEAEV
jgi:hypothetical protein